MVVDLALRRRIEKPAELIACWWVAYKFELVHPPWGLDLARACELLGITQPGSLIARARACLAALGVS